MKKSLVMIIIDSLRQDHVGAYGNDWIKTPHLDAFAKDSMVFTRCYAESLPTLQFRRSIHTGNRVYPFSDFNPSPKVDPGPAPGWGNIPDEEDTIAEVLKDQGYWTAMVSDVVHALKATRNYHRGFDSFLFVRGNESDRYNFAQPVPDSMIDKHLNDKVKDHEYVKKFLTIYLRNAMERRSEEDFQAAKVFREAAKWLGNHYDAERIFLNIDSFDPHEPWDPPVYYRRMYSQDEGVADLIASPYCPWKDAMSERELKRIQANYAGKVTMTDRWFGHFMETMGNCGRLDDTVVVVMSDHGHCLGYDPKDKGFISKHGHAMTRAVADLVMMIRHPSGEGAGQVCDKLMYNIDITRTLFDLIGVEPAQDMDGVNVWPTVMSGEGEIRDHITMAWGSNITVIKDKWWYNANVFGEAELLNDLEEDPDLTVNLADQHPEICKEMLDLAIEDAGDKFDAELFRRFTKQPNSALWRFGKDGEIYCSAAPQIKFSN
jgi:arylsulfatase A-like enzyme